MVEVGYVKECERFFTTYNDVFASEHEDDLRSLSAVGLPEHLKTNTVSQVYLHARYRLTLTSMAYFSLISFLETREAHGGAVVIDIIQKHCNVVTVERGNMDPNTLAGLLNKARQDQDMPMEDEGIPGHNPASARTENEGASNANLPRLKLGALPMEPELRGDVEAELEEEDAKAPPVDGQPSLLEEFRQIKREESEDGPRREDVPLPPSVARDVAMEVAKVKEYRARFKVDKRTGGVGPGLSVCMFTFHNTYDKLVSPTLSSRAHPIND